MSNEPTSLTEMQQMDASDFKQVDRYDYRGDVSSRKLIRHIIELASDELSWQGRNNANSLRDFWYNPTKPILERALPEKVEDEDFKFSRRMSQYLSDVMSEMVKDGRVSYRELNILDDSRERQVNRGTIEEDKILFVEKDAAYRKLKPLEQVYKLSIVSGSGFQATALIEDLAHELNGAANYQLYVLSDFDPTGFKIVNDFEERAGQLGIEVKSVTRLGIEPRQLDQTTVEEQKFSPPVNSEADREWMDQHGIDGEYGLELEAIGDLNEKGPELRRVVIEALKDDIRTEERYVKDVESSTGAGVYGAVQSTVNSITGDLESGLMDAAVEKLRGKEGIEKIDRSFSSPDVDITGLDEAQSSEWVANPPEEEALHKGAQSGRYYGASNQDLKQMLKDELQQMIEEDEIDVMELLEVEE